MLDTTVLWNIAARLPRLWRGAALHRWGLVAAHRGRFDLAERLFEAAGCRYRIELRIEPLARLRVHQLMTRLRASGYPERDAAGCLEVERLLTNLDRLESPEPPFALVQARTLLARWIHHAEASGSDDRDDATMALAA